MAASRTATAPLLALAALLACLPAHALHRCTTAEGKVTYTEFSCEAGAKASGVEIHDSSGMNINKRTNDFTYKSPPAPARNTGSSSRSTPARSTPPASGARGQTVGDVYVDKGEYKSKSGDTLSRPPMYRQLEKGADKATEQRKLDREWDDYNKQQQDLRQKYRDQPLK